MKAASVSLSIYLKSDNYGHREGNWGTNIIYSYKVLRIQCQLLFKSVIRLRKLRTH